MIFMFLLRYLEQGWSLHQALDLSDNLALADF